MRVLFGLIFFLDAAVYNQVATNKQQLKFKKRQFNLDSSTTPPVELYVELLVVTDRSVFDDHKRFAQTNDNEVAFLHMRTYFTHFINGVNQRFQNSFANDPDLRVTIRLKNFLFLSVKYSHRIAL